MSEKIWSVTESLGRRANLLIESANIVSETEKRVTVDAELRSYRWNKKINKSQYTIYRTKRDALLAFEARMERQIEAKQKQLDELDELLQKTRNELAATP